MLVDPEVRNRLVLMPADIVAGEEQVSGSGLEDKNLSADLETTLDEGRSSWVDSRGLRSLRQSDAHPAHTHGPCVRSEEHTSELQSLMRISYAVFCLKKKKHKKTPHHEQTPSN